MEDDRVTNRGTKAMGENREIECCEAFSDWALLHPLVGWRNYKLKFAFDVSNNSNVICSQQGSCWSGRQPFWDLLKNYYSMDETHKFTKSSVLLFLPLYSIMSSNNLRWVSPNFSHFTFSQCAAVSLLSRMLQSKTFKTGIQQKSIKQFSPCLPGK